MLFTKAIDPDLDGENLRVLYNETNIEKARQWLRNIITNASSEVPNFDEVERQVLSLLGNNSNPNDANLVYNGDFRKV